MSKHQAFFPRLGIALAVAVLAVGSAWADADSSSHQSGDPNARASLDGATVYRQYCMACHMADGQGAQGAGAYPALANNPKLAAAPFPLYVLLHGQGAMPWFNGLLKDEEIAAVVGYIRTHFGNDYPDAPTADDVARMRGPVPVE